MMKRLFALSVVVLFAACSTDKTIESPAELVDFEQHAHFDEVWSHDIGDLDPDLRLGLVPAVDEQNVYVADHDGTVQAFRLADGERVWEHKTGEFHLWGDSGALPFSAGTAVANGKLVIGTTEGDVLALDAATGETLWRVNVNGELLAAPVIVAGFAAMRTTDGRMVALDLATGEQRWDTVRDVPLLTVRGLSAAATDGQRIYAGFDNGKVAALNVGDGNMIWEATLATPAGASALESIIDVDGDIALFGREVYATSYNGFAAALAAESGEILWRHEVSSVRTPAVGFGNVFVTDIDSEVHAYERLSGAEQWTQDRLRARYLTAPAVFGDLVVVGDFEGYLHFFDVLSGEMVARIEHGGEPIDAQPVVAGDLLIVLSGDGELAAWRRTDSKETE